MYLLSVPELEPLLDGLVLIRTAPNADWLPAFAAMTERNRLPAVAYVSTWLPHRLPTVIIGGGESLWPETGEHVLRCTIDGGAHVPWIERPAAVSAAFADLAALL